MQPSLFPAMERVDVFENSSSFRSPGSQGDSFATEIFPWLYLGNARDAADFPALVERDIKYILNISKEDSPGGSPETNGYRYMKLSLDDNSEVPIGDYFEVSHQFIEDARKNNSKVLVHCRKGVSRSATIVIAYVMKHKYQGFEDAFDYVKKKRSIINPNLGFVLALEALESLQSLSPPSPGLTTSDAPADSPKARSASDWSSGDDEDDYRCAHMMSIT